MCLWYVLWARTKRLGSSSTCNLCVHAMLSMVNTFVPRILHNILQRKMQCAAAAAWVVGNIVKPLAARVRALHIFLHTMCIHLSAPVLAYISLRHSRVRLESGDIGKFGIIDNYNLCTNIIFAFDYQRCGGSDFVLRFSNNIIGLIRTS